MGLSIWAWLVSAVVIFWLIGLYNRLMRLRARAVEVGVELEQQIKLCTGLLIGYVEALSVPSSSESVSNSAVPDEWLSLMHVVHAVDVTWGATRKSGLSQEVQHKRAESWVRLQVTWDEFLAQPPDLAGERIPQELRIEWENLRQKAKSIQEALNSIIEAYNIALQEYPARCVVRLMGFKQSAKI